MSNVKHVSSLLSHLCLSTLLIMLTSVDVHASSVTVSEETTDAGIEFTLVTIPDNPRVSIQIVWPNYWALDKNNNPAIPHIGTRLIMEGGADGYTPGEVVERFADMETEGSLAANLERVFGTLHYSPEHQDETLDIVNAHLRSPTLSERFFNRLRDQFAASREEQRAHPSSIGLETIRWAILGNQPARNALSMDNSDVIETIQLDKIKDWTKQVLNRNNATIVIAGDLTVEQAKAAITRLLAGLPEGKRIEPIGITPDYTPRRVLLHQPESKTSVLTFIAPMPPLREGSEFEDILLTMALGSGNRSVLFNAVRTELRASYGYGAGLDAFTREHRILVMSGEVDTEKLAEAEQVVRKAYAEFKKQGIQDDIEAMKAPIFNNLDQSIQDTGSTAYSVLMSKLDGFPAERALNLSSELTAVDKASLKRRLDTGFPDIDDFLVFVRTSDEKALTEACIITSPEEAINC